MKKLILVFQMLSLIYIYHAAILNVAIDGTQAFTSIQTAIEASNNGDTVLVHPGRYFENVDFIGKSIILCSLEATSGDSSYIATTIIDGNNSGSCIRLVTQEQNVSIRGFTLEHGTGYPFGAQSLNIGGGLVVKSNGSVTVTNCDIQNNHSSSGAGIYITQGTVVLSGVDIHDNYATASVGGLFVYSHYTSPTSITFDPINRCSIYNNYGGNPCDIYIYDVLANLDIYLDMATVTQPGGFYCQRMNQLVSGDYHDTIYTQRAFREEVNHDLYVSPYGDDNNSGLSPDEAMKSITRAVHRIASDSLDVKTVHVLPGTYSEGNGDQIFPIPGKSYVRVIGESASACTLYSSIAHTSDHLFFIRSFVQHDAYFSGFTITTAPDPNRRFTPINCRYHSLTLSDITICDTQVNWLGAVFIGVYAPQTCTIDNLRINNVVTDERIFSANMCGSITNCTFENITSTYPEPYSDWIMTMFDLWARGPLKVDNCVFRNFNVAGNQPTLHISDPNQPTGNVDISISNCLFDNLDTDDESPIAFNNRNVEKFQVNNCTFVNNRGIAGTVGLTGKIYMKNNIFNNPDSSHEIYIYPPASTSNVYLDFNNIRGGEASINNPYSNNYVYYADTNISADPAFSSLDPDSPLFATLSEYSPCINGGTPDTEGLGLPPYDLAGNWRVWNGRIDMGCYEYGSEPYVGVGDPVVPELPAFSICNYPNPFTGFTNIKVILPSNQGNDKAGVTSASIDIYNIKGQRVKSIPLDPGKAGEQFSYWDGRDEAGKQCSSGIYILNLKVNGIGALNKKVTLIR